MRSRNLLTEERVDRVAFGLFEADLHSGELWKAGYRIKLPRQPFRVLAALLERPGHVVTREDLQREIWGVNTNVDFDQAIAAAVNKIREALGDSAENPRFIQTLTKRGYKFIAPVTTVLPPSVEHPADFAQEGILGSSATAESSVGAVVLEESAVQATSSVMSPFKERAHVLTGDPSGPVDGFEE